MGTAASLFLDPRVYLGATIALPLLAWIAPPQLSVLFAAFIIWLCFSSKKFAAATADSDVPDKLAAYRRQLFGMMIVVASGLVVMAVVTYARMRGTVAGPSAGNEELIGLYDGYRGFRVGYAVIISIFSLLYGALQTQRTLASTDGFELSKMQHVEDIWVGNHSKNIMGGMVTLWTTTLLLLAVRPTTVLQNLKPLLSTLGELRTAAGAA